MPSEKPVLGILVGGGPAPGINGVISAATIEARNNGLEVLGFLEGFKHLCAGCTDFVKPLDIRGVSRIHFQGGSILQTSRANPTKSEEHMQNVLRTLNHFNVKYLLTIGGDDTAYSASQVALRAVNQVAVAHVPKTIDNDLPLPPGIPTFGFQTARHAGVEIVQNLMADAQTSPRWYIVVAMGRNAGHLALGIGKAAAAPLTIIPEEFPNGASFDNICDILEGAIIKRAAHGRPHGVAILAEGLVELMADDIIRVFGSAAVSYDEHGHIRLDDIELGRHLRDALRKRFADRGMKVSLISKNLGYELRCADPIPFDCEYTRDLGYGGVRFLLSGGSGAIITFQGGVMKPLPFEESRDPVTGRPRVRMVDVHGESYQVARNYMIRLEPHDRQNPENLEKMAKTAKMSVEEFLEKFGYLMQ